MPHECKQEERIRKLERNEAVVSTEVKNLIKKLDDLTGWIKALVMVSIPLLATALGFLIMKWVGK